MTRRNGARAATIIPIGARRQGDQLATIFAARHEFAVGTFGTCRSFRRDGDIRLNFTHRAFAGSRACELTEINYGLSVSMRSSCAANPEGVSDAHSGLGDFGDRDGLNRAGGGPDVRSGLSGLPAQVRTGHLLRMPLHVAASVQRVGIGPRGTVRHQSIFRGLFRARGLSAASSRLLKADSALVSESERQVEQ